MAGKSRGLVAATASSPRGGLTSSRTKGTHDALRTSIIKAKTGVAYSAWSKDLLRKTCHLRGIAKMSQEKNKEPMVTLLEEVDGRKRWREPGRVTYVGDLDQLLAKNAGVLGVRRSVCVVHAVCGRERWWSQCTE